MVSLVRSTESFRDRSGEIYVDGGRIYRSVNAAAASSYEILKDWAFFENAQAAGFYIGGEEVDVGLLGSASGDPRYLVEHPRLSFISYPYEWSFAQLKAAALLHLDLQIFALDRGVVLSDASAYNVQFIGARPVFIDLLSFRPYREGEYWTGQRQFSEQFLNPLLMRSLLGITHNAWFRGRLEGIPASDLAALIPLIRKFSWNVLWHVVLPSHLQRAAGRRAVDTAPGPLRPLPKNAYRRMLLSLRNFIDRLKPADDAPSAWRDYADDNIYAGGEIERKRGIVTEFAGKLRPRNLWDIGCNTGAYAELAIQAGARHVIGLDSDPQSLDRAFQRALDRSLPLIALHVDAANPSPGQGWNEAERKSLKARADGDALLALAFVHHLAIGRNIPLDWVLQWLVDLAPRGLIEFVPKDDPTVRRMLALREDIFDDYSEAAFATSLGRLARIERVEAISQSGRKVYWYDRT
jgi:ribosomal protein L11 methylase PrmA